MSLNLRFVVYFAFCYGDGSPLAHLHVVGMLRFMSDINQSSLPTSYSVLVTISDFMALSTVFYSINSLDNSPHSHTVLPVLLYLSTIKLYLFIKVSFSPDIILCG